MNWTKDFFHNLYWELFMKRTDTEIAKEVKIIKAAARTDFKTILDVCCGVGDIAHALSEQAYGIEYSPDYINNNRLKNLICGDATEKLTDKEFDLVINWYSSFAYFEPEKNKKLIENCYEYSKKVFLLETYDGQKVLDNFQSLIEYEKEHNDKVYHIKRRSKLEGKKLYQTWNINSVLKNTFSYLYLPYEIVELFESVGFKSVEIITNGEKRIIVRGEK